MRRTTAIIVTYNSADAIEACLDRIPRDVPVIVVDNASTDRTRQIIAASDRPITLLRQTRNSGYGRAANRGLAAATTRYAFLLNPDTLLEPDTIRLLEQEADRFPDRPILAPALLDADGRPASRYRDWRSGERVMEHDADVATVIGCAMFLRLERLQEIGYFDEAFFLYHEETDLCRRAAQASCPVRYVSAARAVHLGGRSSGGGPRGRLLAHFEWSRCYYDAKHGNRYLAAGASHARRLKYTCKTLWYRLLSPHHKAIEYHWRTFGTTAFLRGFDADGLQASIESTEAGPRTGT